MLVRILAGLLVGKVSFLLPSLSLAWLTDSSRVSRGIWVRATRGFRCNRSILGRSSTWHRRVVVGLNLMNTRQFEVLRESLRMVPLPLKKPDALLRL